MELETKQVSIDTLSVTIQSLHVNSKQMTLSVFRQIPKCRIYDENGELIGFDLWGIVRYGIKYEGWMWAVVSHEGKIYRCDVDHPFGEIDKWQKELNEYKMCLREHEIFNTEMKKINDYREARDEFIKSHRNEVYERDYRFRDEYINEFGPPFPFENKYYRPNLKYPASGYKHEDLQENINLAKLALQKAKTAEKTKNKLLALPQLFIAV